MKTAAILSCLSRNSGGLFESVARLHQSLADIPDVENTILGVRDEFTDSDASKWAPIALYSYPLVGPRAFAYAPALRHHLLQADYDLLHTHGIWQYPSIATLAWHRRTSRPYVVSIHGMVDHWALSHSAWKKRLARFVYEDSHLRHAACIRALSETEAEAIRRMGHRGPICVIPNGVDLPTAEANAYFKETCLSDLPSRQKILLYLGRLHPKKGLINLLKAWAVVQSSPETWRQAAAWTLVIAGLDQDGHQAELKRLALTLGLTFLDIDGPSQLAAGNCSRWGLGAHAKAPIVFVGPQFDDAKAACYTICDAFVLPSFSEGLPIAVLEAWAFAKPTLITPECNIPDAFATASALRIETDATSIAQGLEALFSAAPRELQRMGRNGRNLTLTRFSWENIAIDMKAVYDWILLRGAKPRCVVRGR
jgi:glycosyltransferase involved in cell wall biosynthesis